MDWKDKKFLVFGTGISGIAAAELLQEKGIAVVLYDGNPALDKEVLWQKAPKLKDVPVVCGELQEEQWKDIDIVVLSPGVPLDLEIVQQMKEKGMEIWGEIELAYVFGKGHILAITGTNGKTTTTTLLGEMMKYVYPDVKVVGNIGMPYAQAALETTEKTVIVAEISSFQLETIHHFCPEVSAILNITPDHLDRHHTMENYIRAKFDITKNQKEKHTCVLNYEDTVLREFGEKIAADTIYFSSERVLERGVFLQDEEIWYQNKGEKQFICNVCELQIIGKHNYENVMAATAMALSFGITIEQIREVLLQFQAVEHRIEYVDTKDGVLYYNDSKGTNPDAAIQAVKAMTRPTVLIGGGYDKGADFTSWIEAFDGKVKNLILLGATSEKIAKTALACGYPKENILFADSMEDAVALCREHAKEGDAVLLSPACASWGMFKNYEERGNIFKEIVRNLKE